VPAISSIIKKETRDKRLPKQLGDFAEGLVVYVLGQMRGMSVAQIDHVGADIIAADRKTGERFAISVKSRIFSKKTGENRAYGAEFEHIKKLEDTARTFDMKAAVAFVFKDDADGVDKIRIIIAAVDDLKKNSEEKKSRDFLHRTKDSITINFNTKNAEEQMKDCSFIDYIEFELKENGKSFRFPSKNISGPLDI